MDAARGAMPPHSALTHIPICNAELSSLAHSSHGQRGGEGAGGPQKKSSWMLCTFGKTLGQYWGFFSSFGRQVSVQS